MSAPVLATKLYIPPLPPRAVLRPRLVDRLNEGLHRKLTLVSAAAGFGKTTLLSEWVAECNRPVAWLSLDEGDSDPARFLTYMVAALRTVAPSVGDAVLGILQSPQPPPIDAVLTTLVNDITTLPDSFVLVLDDYHVVEATAVDDALAFLIEHMPPQLRLVIATREDPRLPLARLRGRDQLTELRVTELRFTPSEAAGFLNQAMGLNLPAEDIDALETRTEGWIAGLQLAAISLQGHQAPASFIKSFTGSHHFVLDYLVEEVLQHQPESVQNFLLRTSILDRMCGPLCDAVLFSPPGSGQEALEYLEHANLFMIPLDNERSWYRYHHLFADLLRQRLRHSLRSVSSSGGDDREAVAELHIRASQWYEDNHLEIEAFHHAAAANDVERAERLIEGRGTPLHLRGLVTSIIEWLGSLPTVVLDARPSLWVKYGSLLLVVGQTTGVEEKLDAGEAALQNVEETSRTRSLIGNIAAARATLALTRYQADVMLAQSRRALEYLSPRQLSLRANANWTMGYAYVLQGDRVAARQALTEAIALSQAGKDIFTTILATVGLGNVEEVDNRLYAAAEIYRRVLQLAGDQPLQIIYEAHLGLARVLYEWNDLQGAEHHGQQSLHLARQYDKVIDRFIVCEVFLARLKLAEEDVDGATDMLAQAEQSARQRNFVFRIPEVAAAQVVTLLRQGNVAAADHLVQTYDLPVSRARVHLARGDTSSALSVLEPLGVQMEVKGWHDEHLKVMILQALALHAASDKERAVQVLGNALALAEPGGFIRVFVDEGPPMAQLLEETAGRGIMSVYTAKLILAFEAENEKRARQVTLPTTQPLIEALSKRELEVLQLIADGLSNNDISERLFLALDTVKGHNQKIFGKLQVQRRTEAVARARELGLI